MSLWVKSGSKRHEHRRPLRVIFDRFNMILRRPVILPEADVRTAGVYEYTRLPITLNWEAL